MKKALKMFSIAAVLLLTIVLLLPTQAKADNILDSGDCGDNLTWVLTDDGALTISGEGEMYDYYSSWGSPSSSPFYDWRSEITSVAIEDGVTSIGAYAFYGCTGLKDFVIPDSVTHIGEDAFNGCTGLTSITIPDGVTVLNDRVFYGCFNLTDVMIPDSVTSIGGGAFAYCYDLTSVTIPEGVTQIGGNAFSHCQSLTQITISGSVTDIGAYAFWRCTNLETVVFSEGVTTLGEFILEGCPKLTGVSIPDSITSIGDYAFRDSNNVQYNEYGGAKYLGNNENPYVALIEVPDKTITECTIPEGTRLIYRQAFADCVNLTEIVVPDSVRTIGSEAFSGCTALERMTVPFAGCSADDNTTLVSIFGYYSYDVPYSLKTIVLSDACTAIGDGEFTWCSELTEVVIGKNVKTIGANAFQGCTGLTEVTIPEGVTDIGDYAFSYCSSLTSIEIPDSMTSIGSGVFDGCENLVYNEFDNARYLGNANNPYHALILTLNDDLRTCKVHDNTKLIAAYAFGSCRALYSVTLPEGLINIGYGAFDYCSDLEKITIPDSAICIEDRAFYETGLADLTIGKGVTHIGEDAFRESGYIKNIHISDLTAWCHIEFANEYANPLVCSYAATTLYLNGVAVTDPVIPEGTTRIGDYVFAQYNKLNSIVLPDSVTSIGNGAFSWCEKLTGVVLGNGVTSIGDFAFQYCSALTDITLPQALTEIGDRAFDQCGELMEIVLPEGLTHIGEYAFRECSGLTEITIPGSVVSMGKGAFYYCAGLTRATLEQGLTCIGEEMFNSCYSLNSVMIPATVTGIGSGAFYSCALTEVTIPESVTTIGAGAFYNNSLTSLVIPEGVTRIEENAFESNPLLTVTLPESLTYVHYGAFMGCWDIWHVLYAGSEEQWELVQVSGYGDDALYSATWHYNSKGDEIIDLENRICALCCEHELGDVVTVAPTCTEQGYSTGVCGLCGYTVQYDYVAALGHSGEWVTDLEATCTEDGSRSWTCTVCGETETEVIPATGHAYKSHRTEATCTEDGCTTHICTNCGDTYTDDHQKALGHSYGKCYYVDETNHKRTCSACGAEETGTHAWQSGVTDPTCTEDGYTTYTCVACSHGYVDDPVPATGHHYENGFCVSCGQPERELGDVNGDGGVDIFDANLAASYYNEVVELDAIQLQAADVNGDGAVDIFDANLIAAYYNEVIDAFPIQ